MHINLFFLGYIRLLSTMRITVLSLESFFNPPSPNSQFIHKNRVRRAVCVTLSDSHDGEKQMPLFPAYRVMVFRSRIFHHSTSTIPVHVLLKSLICRWILNEKNMVQIASSLDYESK